MKGFINEITEEDARTIYYLLYSNYGGSIIASTDDNLFKYKLFATIWQFAPTWTKRLAIQKDLRALSKEDIMKGSTQIYNSALNPNSEPTTSTLEELEYINAQNTTKNKRDTLSAYNNLMLLLATDVTQEFITKFKNLFLKVVTPQPDLYYKNSARYDADGIMVSEYDGLLFGGMTPQYQTPSFTDLYPNEEEFLKDWREQ